MPGQLEAIEPDEIEEFPGNGNTPQLNGRQDLIPSARVAGVAAAGGIVLGVAATAAVVKVAARRHRPQSRRLRRRKNEPAHIALSRSFLIDVHMLGK